MIIKRELGKSFAPLRAWQENSSKIRLDAHKTHNHFPVTSGNQNVYEFQKRTAKCFYSSFQGRGSWLSEKSPVQTVQLGCVGARGCSQSLADAVSSLPMDSDSRFPSLIIPVACHSEKPTFKSCSMSVE